MNELLLSLRLGWQVVVRNWTVYRKDFLANISPTLADPALILGSLGMGLSGFVGQIDGMSYAQFLAPGMIATTALFTAFFESSYGFYVRMTFESVFKAMLTTPIGVREVVLGEFMWVFVRAALMGFGVALVLLALGLLPNPYAILICPFIAGVLSLPCAAIGAEHQPVPNRLLIPHRADLLFVRCLFPHQAGLPAGDPDRILAVLPRGEAHPVHRVGSLGVAGDLLAFGHARAVRRRALRVVLPADREKADHVTSARRTHAIA
jgi:hypothetical protein